MEECKIQDVTEDGGGELTMAAMDKYRRAEAGRRTLEFVRRCMRNPVLQKQIQNRASEIRSRAEADV